jgi:hypothetical protein
MGAQIPFRKKRADSIPAQPPLPPKKRGKKKKRTNMNFYE